MEIRNESRNENKNENKNGNKIEISGITKVFGETTVLDAVNLDISGGEIFGLLGPSGAGKTTLIKILTGQAEQTSGTARLLGADTRQIPDEVYTQIGMVLDNTGLYERLSCYDNLKLYADIYKISADSIRRVLKKVGLEESLKKPVHQLSKGMKQRLVLARAIMHSPRILFLDEPTSGLDPGTAARIHGLVREQQEKGTTVFLTTHNMEEASKLCCHVALLHQGRIVEYGEPDEVCRRYNNQKQIRILLKDGRNLLFPNDGSAAEELCGFFRQNQMESIHSTEPNLETVFMELTGRKFEE